ncbi:cellulose binding domain-containing protein, partial [Micromonospora echinofusca]
MTRSRSLVLSLVTALVGAVAAIWVAVPALAAGPTATFTKTNDWGTGWEGKYTITNGGGTTISSWNVTFDLPAGTTLGSYWDALLTSSGQRHTFTNRSW